MCVSSQFTHTKQMTLLARGEEGGGQQLGQFLQHRQGLSVLLSWQEMGGGGGRLPTEIMFTAPALERNKLCWDRCEHRPKEGRACGEYMKGKKSK